MLTLYATLMKICVNSILCGICLLIFQGLAYCEIATLVGSGETWTYLDNGTEPESSWKAYAFNDSGWLSGNAQFGYGDGDESSLISYGPDPNNKYITTYFRKTFFVGAPSLYKCLKLKLLRDDGAVVYINGIEVARSNIQDGSINSQTLASETVSGIEENTFFVMFIDPEVLLAGELNVIGVEIHQRSPASSDISFDLELSASTSACFEKEPYLIYTGHGSSMDIHWQLTDSDSACIEWGEDSSYSAGIMNTAEYGSRHQHRYTIPDLTPGTKYYYRISADSVEKDHQKAGSFTASPAQDSENIKFIVYGDTRSNPDIHDTVAESIMSAMNSDRSFQTLLLCVGDLVSAGKNESSWRTEFFDPTYLNIQQLLSNIPFISCVGNHELNGTDGNLFEIYFPYPYVAGHYWSFDYGPIHVAVIDQYIEYNEGSIQRQWLESDLASTSKRWKFIVLHEPGWSSGGHVNNIDVQRYIQPLCKQYGVSIVFAGHNHYYARAIVDGIYHITTGGGGAPLYLPGSNYPGIVTASSVNHYCKVDIKKNILTFQVVDPNGAIIDAFQINGGNITPALFLLLPLK